jgi:hypothetical protein
MLQGHRERHERGSEGAAAGGHHVGAGVLELVVIGAERERGQELSRREEDPLARGAALRGQGWGRSRWAAARPWRAGSEAEATRTMERVEQASRQWARQT